MRGFENDFRKVWNDPNSIVPRIIIVNAAVFVFTQLMLYIFQYKAVAEYLYLSHNLQDFIYKPLSILTYGFVHADFYHILFNMLGLYWFGIVIADFMGRAHILPLLIWGILGGGVSFLIAGNLIPGISPLMVGASGGVFAVMVGAATIAPDFRFHLLLIGPAKIKYIALVYLVLSFLQLRGGNSGGGLAHLAGGLIGYLYVVQLKAGKDWSMPITQAMDWIQRLFTKAKSNFNQNKRQQKAHNTQKAAYRKSDASAASQTKVDEILDKISEKGYEALTPEEKKILFKASQE